MSFGKWFLSFALISIFLGALSFFLGEKLPRRWFRADAFPFRCYAWEQNGAIYEKISVRRWKSFFPDMSRIVRSTYTKKLGSMRDTAHVRRLIEETCSAEAVHWALVLLSVLFPLLMGPSGWIAMALYNVVGNLPPIIIQRYNRPRVMLLLEKMERAAQKRTGAQI